MNEGNYFFKATVGLCNLASETISYWSTWSNWRWVGKLVKLMLSALVVHENKERRTNAPNVSLTNLIWRLTYLYQIHKLNCVPIVIFSRKKRTWTSSFKLLDLSWFFPCRDIHKEVLLAILSCWPAVIIACIMTYVAGIVVWALVSFLYNLN